jgi:hypothetical protein
MALFDMSRLPDDVPHRGKSDLPGEHSEFRVWTKTGHCVAASEADCLSFLARRPVVKC